MFSFKKLALIALLACGLSGSAFAAERIESSWDRAGSKVKSPTTSITANVGRIHSVDVKAGMIGWQVDLSINGAKGRECLIEIELCNTTGVPYLNSSGTPIKLMDSITPDRDNYQVTDLAFRISSNRFWEIYGRSAKDLTFKICVTEVKTGKTLNTTDIMKLNGLGTKLPPATTEKTDNPTINPGRYGSAWMRLIFA